MSIRLFKDKCDPPAFSIGIVILSWGIVLDLYVWRRCYSVHIANKKRLLEGGTH